MHKQFWAVVFLFGASASVGLAQVSEVRAGSFELGGFVGASYGIDQTRVMGGGNVTYGFSKIFLGYVEYSYFPGIGRVQHGTISGTNQPFTSSYSLPLSDFHGGVHVRLPIFREKPVVPYLVFGVGALSHFDRTVKVNYTDASGQSTLSLDVPGGSDFAFNTGGGIRFYMGQRFGMRVEAKVYKPTGTFSDTFGKVEVGFFYQTH